MKSIVDIVITTMPCECPYNECLVYCSIDSIGDTRDIRYSSSMSMILIAWQTLMDHATITVTSLWARWCFKSPASPVFTQFFIRVQMKETSSIRVTGLCAGNLQRASNAENVSIWWRHHDHYCSKRPDYMWTFVDYTNWLIELSTAL